MGYTASPFDIHETAIFARWFASLRDARAKAAIVSRLDSARIGNLGDFKSVGGGVSEMRINVGAGYRVYFTRHDQTVVFLPCGGDKSSQRKDIARAQRLANHD
jgi:putative addiction module killer protein